MNTAAVEGRREEKPAEAVLALWDSCAHPSWGPGRIPPRLLAIQQACHAFLPTFPGAQEAGGEGLGPVPGGSGTLPGPTPTNAQCWLHASGGPPVI